MVQLNSNLNAAERLFKLCDVPAEGPLVLDSDDAIISAMKNPVVKDANQERHPAIEFRNVSLRYREDLELTLKQVSFTVK